ncbi:kelch repeat protein [Gigaspora margarita]|uniref:Kelch repeat protein n=1 Tax=Gigaspora margarita TaxID=4874 RepID=A0A8H4AZP6_GIGMA|nr:kelch repeat protein [Gigaspora margarita]
MVGTPVTSYITVNTIATQPPGTIIVIHSITLGLIGLLLLPFCGAAMYYCMRRQKSLTDLNNISLDENTVIDSSKWIQVTKNKNASLAEWPFLGGISNDNLFFATLTSEVSVGVYVNTFDTTLNQWKTNLSFIGYPSLFFLDIKPWITDGSTGKAYSLQEISGVVDIFDIVNYVWTNSSVFSRTYPAFISLVLSGLYGPPQVLLSSGVILYFTSESSTTINDTTSMNNILSYNVKTDSWQFINTTGQVPSLRRDYTAVLTSDGHSTPSEINPVGPLTQHTSIMVNNYMIAAFGLNVTESNTHLQNNKNIYKLDISDPLTYKWSVLSIYNDDLTTITKSILPPSATPNSKVSSLPKHSSSNNNGLFLGVGFAVAMVIILALIDFGFIRNQKQNILQYLVAMLSDNVTLIFFSS